MKLLIVDDSALMRRYLSEMMSGIIGIQVITARDGHDALERIENDNPDVVTLDINMPNMDGLTCLSHIMTRFPRPVVMVSSITEVGATATFEALEMGALDYITKPGGTVSLNIKQVRNEMLVKVRSAYRQRHLFSQDKKVSRHTALEQSKQGRLLDTQVRGVVVIGVSTGGPSTLERILPYLSADLPLPVVVCQHMPGTFTGVFAQRLNTRCALEVVEVLRPTELLAGKIYVAQGDADTTLTIRNNRPYLVSSPLNSGYNWHPSVSLLLQSIIKSVPAKQVIPVMLTGMGDDGAQEMKLLHDNGATSIAEREQDCAVYGMPKALVELGGATHIAAVDEVASLITRVSEKVARIGVINSWA